MIQDKKDQLTMKLYLQNSTENLKNITLLFISRVFKNSIEQNIGNLSSFKGPILIKHLNISNDTKKKCENFLFNILSLSVHFVCFSFYFPLKITYPTLLYYVISYTY